MGIAPEKVLMLPNAIGEEMLDASANGAAVRGRHGCEHALVIGFVGWFVAWHRLDALLGQFALLARAHPSLPVMLVRDRVLLEKLRAPAEQLGIRERLIFSAPVAH